MNVYEQLRKSKHKNNNEMEKEWTVADLVNEFQRITPNTKIDRNKINRIENGAQKPDADTLIAYSKVFDISVDYLLGISPTATIDEDIRMIGKTTGLSDISINMLKQYKDLYCDILNYLLENNSLHDLIKTILINAPTSNFQSKKDEFLTHSEYVVLRKLEDILKKIFTDPTLTQKIEKYRIEVISAQYGVDPNGILELPQPPVD